MRTFVILGIVLLIASLVGVKLLMDSGGAAGNAKDKDANKPPDKVVCWGYFDVEKGVAMLYPRQNGNVVWLGEEGKRYEKDAPILQVEDALWKLKIKEAQAALNAAEGQLAEAKKLPEAYKLQAEQQQSAVKAIDSEIEKTKLDQKIKLQGLTDDSELKKNSERYYKVALDQLAERKKVEEAKLKEMGLRDPQLKIQQAEAERDAKKLQVEQAQEMLKHFRIEAPEAGTVLRIYSHVGETLGPNPRTQAVDFLPDQPIIVRAEVLQEWGRFVKTGAEVEIEDDTYHGKTWKGTVKSISKWYAPTRSPVIEPFRYNDVRTLECIISVEKTAEELRIGQRVRAMIKMP